MKKKLIACFIAAGITMGGSFYLASPAHATSMFGCPDGWWKACGSAPAGCYISASCVVGNGGTPFVTCTVVCS
ncbi:MAG TPA: hypothetical protein VF092_18085 [Longimicrobium sp.]